MPDCLPAMPFHMYRPSTPIMGSVGLVVTFMTANTAANTPARSSTAKNSIELTQRPALMNFFSDESGTLSDSQVQYSVATLIWPVLYFYSHTDSTVLSLTCVVRRSNDIWAQKISRPMYKVLQLLFMLCVFSLAGHKAHIL